MTKEQPFKDSPYPFMPGDDLEAPKPGDILILRDMEVNMDYPRRIAVWRVHESLAESWDPVGEAAWQQHDVNEMVGHRGHWYALCEDEFAGGDEYVVASYEVAAIERRGV